MKQVWCALIALFAAVACSEPTRPAQELNVFAASSLRESCQEIGAKWAAAHPKNKLHFNFGASNVLAQQIVASKKCDVFLSADAAQLDVVRKAGLVVNVSQPGWLSNQLVVVVPASPGDERIEGAGDLARPEFARLSLANPDAVPAGKYAKAWLESKGEWKDFESRVVPGLYVRAALAAVESQACDVGIVYATDAAITGKVRVAFRVPLEDGPRIEYFGAVLQTAAWTEYPYDEYDPQRPYDEDHQPTTAAIPLLDFFMGAEARKVFERRGFIVGELH
jgi:molybdate transport system substrate-binding protein